MSERDYAEILAHSVSADVGNVFAPTEDDSVRCLRLLFHYGTEDGATPLHDERFVAIDGLDALIRQLVDLRAKLALGHEPGADGRRCELCHQEIVDAQHYLRLAVIADTAGLERPLEAPHVVWSGIFDSPACAGVGLARDAHEDPILVDIFDRR